MNNTITIALITGGVTILNTAILFYGQHYFNLRRRKKLKNLLNTNETKELIIKCDSEYEKKFIIPDIKESYFYAQTGIQTHHKFIQKYVDLRDKLGFNWRIIRSAKSFINLDDEEAKIIFKKVDNFQLITKITLGTILIITPYFYYFFSNVVNPVHLITLFISLITSIVVFFSAIPILDAKIINRRLKKLNKTKENMDKF